jgi:hypothetical protein
MRISTTVRTTTRAAPTKDIASATDTVATTGSRALAVLSDKRPSLAADS